MPPKEFTANEIAVRAFVDSTAFAGTLPPLPPIPTNLFDEARTHKSFYGSPKTGFRCVPGAGDNRRIECLGDAVISAATLEVLYGEYDLLSVETMTSIKNLVVCNHTLAGVGRAANLRVHLRVGNSAPDAASLDAGLFEAMAGALWQDEGQDSRNKAVDYIKKVLRPVIEVAYRLLLEQRGGN